MTTYTAPVKDMQFLLHDVLAVSGADIPGYADLDAGFTAAVLDEAGKVASDVLAPLNAVGEIFVSANMAFNMYQGLTHGAYSAIRAHGTAEQKATYLPRMVSCDWTGTMNLTEPHCGTDLGLMRTRAEPQADGSYRITGTKIFISAGEHDLAKN